MSPAIVVVLIVALGAGYLGLPKLYTYLNPPKVTDKHLNLNKDDDVQRHLKA